MNTYQKADERRQQILKAGCELAEKAHYNRIRRHHLVARCGTSAGNISRIMGDMESFKTQLISYAIDHGHNIVVAQAIIDKHPAISHLTGAQRGKILSKAIS